MIAENAELKEGSKRYKALLDEALDLHIRKNTGYAADNPDAFSNFRLATGMGLTPVQGVMVRLGDKFARAQSLFKNPENDKVGEGLRDTLMDLSAYALIAICLIEEEEDHQATADELRGMGFQVTDGYGKPTEHDSETCLDCAREVKEAVEAVRALRAERAERDALDTQAWGEYAPEDDKEDPRDWFDPDMDEPLPKVSAPSVDHPKFKKGEYVTCQKVDGERPHRYNPDEPCVAPVLAEGC